MSYTYSILEVRPDVYDSIRRQLVEAGYGHVFDPSEEYGEVMDMHGIALAKMTLSPEDALPVVHRVPGGRRQDALPVVHRVPGGRRP